MGILASLAGGAVNTKMGNKAHVDSQGDATGLAVGGTAHITFDLGPQWLQFRTVQVIAYCASGDISNPVVFFQDARTPISDARQSWNMAYGEGAACLLSVPQGGADSLPSSAGGYFGVMGRFVRVRIVNNGTVVLGTTDVTFAAYA